MSRPGSYEDRHPDCPSDSADLPEFGELSNQHSPQERPEVWMQCPGCWSANLVPGPTSEIYIECDCGEKLTVIDLRDGGEICTDRGDLTSDLTALQDREAELEKERDEWKGRTEPDISPGDVIAAEPDGTIVLDDGITTWNPARAVAFLLADSEQRANRAEAALREAKAEFEKRAEAEAHLRQKSIETEDTWGAVAHACARDAHLEDAKLLDTSIEDREPEEQQQVVDLDGRKVTICLPSGEKAEVVGHIARGDAGLSIVQRAAEDLDPAELRTALEPPAPCSDRASTQGGDASAPSDPRRGRTESTRVTGGGPEPGGRLASETSTVDKVLSRFRPTTAWWDMGGGHEQEIDWREVVGLVLHYGRPSEPPSSDQEWEERQPIPKRWAGEETGEHWAVVIEHDRMMEGEPCVVTVEVENWEAGRDGQQDRKVDTLACTTPDQAREMSDALRLYADEAEREDGSCSTQPAVPAPETTDQKGGE